MAAKHRKPGPPGRPAQARPAQARSAHDKPGQARPGSAQSALAAAAAETGMPLRRKAALVALIGILGVFGFAMIAFFYSPRPPQPVAGAAKPKPVEGQSGMERVIVTLKGIGTTDADRPLIAKAQDQLLKDLGTKGVQLERRYDNLPQLALSVNSAALALLKAHPLVASVTPDKPVGPLGGAAGSPATGTEPAKK